MPASSPSRKGAGPSKSSAAAGAAQQQQLEQEQDRKRFHALARTNPRMAAVRNTIIRDATREQMRLRALPGHRLRGKVSSILHNHATRESEEADDAVQARRRRQQQQQDGGEPSGGAVGFNGDLGAVDVSLFDEPEALRRGPRLRNGNASETIEQARQRLLLRTATDAAAAAGLDEMATTFVANYVEANPDRCGQYLRLLLTQRLAAQRDARRVKLSGAFGHEHVFPADIAPDCRRAARFPMAELRASSERVIRCVNGAPAFERPRQQHQPSPIGPQEEGLPQLRDSGDGGLMLRLGDALPLATSSGPTSQQDRQIRSAALSAAGPSTTPQQTPQARLRDERERAGGVPGKRLTAPVERAMLEVRLGGLDKAGRRGLDAIDGDPTVLPVLAMPRAHPVPPPSAAGTQAPTPASLASYLTTTTANVSGGSGGREATTDARFEAASDPELESPPPPHHHHRCGGGGVPNESNDDDDVGLHFAFDTATVAGLLNNDAALIHAMGPVLDAALGALGVVPITDGVEEAMERSVAPSVDPDPRVDSGASAHARARILEQQTAAAAPVHVLLPGELAGLARAVDRWRNKRRAAASTGAVAVDAALQSDDEDGMTTSPSMAAVDRRAPHDGAATSDNATSAGARDSGKANGPAATEDESDAGPPGIVGKTLRSIPTAALRSALTAWLSHDAIEQIEAETTGAATTGAGKDGGSAAFTGVYEPHCVICQAAQAEQQHERRRVAHRSPRRRREKFEMEAGGTDQDQRRRAWRSVQTTAFIGAHRTITQALRDRREARETVTASSAHVSGVVAQALEHGHRWGLCRGDAQPSSTTRPESRGPGAAPSGTPPAVLPPLALKPAEGGDAGALPPRAAHQQLSHTRHPGRAHSTPPTMGRPKSRGMSPNGGAAKTPAGGLWSVPRKGMDVEAVHVAQCELFWRRFLVFCRSTGMPATADQTRMLEELRRVLLRVRRVSSALLLRWMAACGPALLEGRDPAKVVAFLRMELGVPASFVAMWRRMPAQRASGWMAANQ